MHSTEFVICIKIIQSLFMLTCILNCGQLQHTTSLMNTSVINTLDFNSDSQLQLKDTVAFNQVNM